MSNDTSLAATAPPLPAPRDSKLRRMANALRALAMDAVEQAKSGHPGMPMGMADIAAVLFTRFLRFDPEAPDWPDRDRFALSNGHGSMLIYALLHLSGYKDMTLDELKHFRQLGSRTAGHPGRGLPTGLETTTGPPGQRLPSSHSARGPKLGRRGRMAARAGQSRSGAPRSGSVGISVPLRCRTTSAPNGARPGSAAPLCGRPGSSALPPRALRSGANSSAAA